MTAQDGRAVVAARVEDPHRAGAPVGDEPRSVGAEGDPRMLLLGRRGDREGPPGRDVPHPPRPVEARGREQVPVGAERQLVDAAGMARQSRPHLARRGVGDARLGLVSVHGGSVGIVDFLGLLVHWGCSPGATADLDQDGFVGVVDLLALLAAWGPCL